MDIRWSSRLKSDRLYKCEKECFQDAFTQALSTKSLTLKNKVLKSIRKSDDIVRDFLKITQVESKRELVRLIKSDTFLFSIDYLDLLSTIMSTSVILLLETLDGLKIKVYRNNEMDDYIILNGNSCVGIKLRTRITTKFSNTNLPNEIELMLSDEKTFRLHSIGMNTLNEFIKDIENKIHEKLDNNQKRKLMKIYGELVG